jgi:hypothetical protein
MFYTAESSYSQCALISATTESIFTTRSSANSPSPTAWLVGTTNPIAWNRYAYVYNAPVNHTDSSGHFIDTRWDVVDLGADALNCLGDSDTLAHYTRDRTGEGTRDRKKLFLLDHDAMAPCLGGSPFEAMGEDFIAM